VTVRFLLDEDLHTGIIKGLQAREPAVDILDTKTAGLRTRKDPALLELAAQQDRILVTHDRNTMTRFFMDRIALGKPNPGIFIVPQTSAIGEIIESLLLIWAASQPDEWRDQIVYLPFR
jgi:predicted nuclease of predicted toxin-antitoxin system